MCILCVPSVGALPSNSTSDTRFFFSELVQRTQGTVLYEEAFALRKGCGFSFSDVLMLTGEEREIFLKLQSEVNEREKEEIDKIQKP